MQFFTFQSKMFRLISNLGEIMTRKWIESLLDDMVESQWMRDIIKQEHERFSKFVQTMQSKSIEDLEPINQFSDKELSDRDILDEDFKSQVENFSKSDYQKHLISKAVENIREDFDVDDEYLLGLIIDHLEEEDDFLDMVVKEAIAEEDYFQNYIERRISQNKYPEYCEDDFYMVEYPALNEEFDDLEDTDYMNQGIFQEPFRYCYYERNFFDEDLLDYSDDFDKSDEFIDIGSEPDDITIEEPEEENLVNLIEEKLFEEKYLDRIFVEIIKKEDYLDEIIAEKLAKDEKLNSSIDELY